MDVDRILESIETLTLSDLRRVLAATAELVERIEGWQQKPDHMVIIPGGCYRLEMVRCGKDTCKKCTNDAYGHGPYWYLYRYSAGKVRKTYIGKERPL